MESPGSDLAVDEQLVRKNSNRGASSSSGTPRPRQADKPNVETPIRTPSIRVDGPSGNRIELTLHLCSLESQRKAQDHRRKNVIRALFGTKTKSLHHTFKTPSARRCGASEETSSNSGKRNLEEEDPSTQLSEEIPEGIPLPTLEVPYLHILEGCIRLLYGVPTDPLWASYPAADMGKLKMKISKAELEATKKKKKDKQAAAKGGASLASDKGQECPTLNVVVEPSSLPIAIPSGDSPSQRGVPAQPLR
ncbi:hypothetical protein FNV43_RR13073 [Rhamnella rubrinervis]|uniref:Uncharacterized protein n=1 Tax=Rhamnella rubrinervis TaxID=2594499 RepID=A0A8K0MEP0_9ROSA|nr:hypothetical protein FNV43_RR13073 [Rhamnella rubrinervis]